MGGEREIRGKWRGKERKGRENEEKAEEMVEEWRKNA